MFPNRQEIIKITFIIPTSVGGYLLVVMQFGKLARNYMNPLYLAMAFLSLNPLAPTQVHLL